MDLANIIQTIAIYAIPVLFAITVHEAAHGYVARHLGYTVGIEPQIIQQLGARAMFYERIRYPHSQCSDVLQTFIRQ